MNNCEKLKLEFEKAIVNGLRATKEFYNAVGKDNIPFDVQRSGLFKCIISNRFNVAKYIIENNHNLVNVVYDIRDDKTKMSVVFLSALYLGIIKSKQKFLELVKFLKYILTIKIDNISNVYLVSRNEKLWTVFDVILNPVKKNKNSTVPLEYFESIRFELLALVINNDGFNPNIKCDLNQTPLIVLIKKLINKEEYADKIKNLIKQLIKLPKCNINFCNNIYESPILLLTAVREYELVEFILMNKNDVDLFLETSYCSSPIKIVNISNDQKLKNLFDKYLLKK